MKIEYIVKNLNLLNLINLDIKTFQLLFERFKNSKAQLDICLNKFYKDNKELQYNDLEINDIYFLMRNYDTLVKHTYLKKEIKKSELFYKEPLIFKPYLLDLSKIEVFILYQANTLFDLLNKIVKEEEYFIAKHIIKLMNEKQVFKYLEHLINSKSNIIFKNSEINKDFLEKFDVLPDFLESYIKDIPSLLLKLKKEHSNETRLKDLLNKPWNIKQELLLADEEFKNLILENLNPKHLRSNFIEILPKNILFKLTKNMNLEELNNLNLGKELRRKIFLNNIKDNLILISEMEEKIIKNKYKIIRKSILNGSPIGKQGLKYFLIKNNSKLDKELLEFVLKKFPRFYNSLKIKIDLNLDKKPFEKKLELSDCIYKKEISQEEEIFIKNNIESLLRMKNLCCLNYKVKEIILDFLK